MGISEEALFGDLFLLLILGWNSASCHACSHSKCEVVRCPHCTIITWTMRYGTALPSLINLDQVYCHQILLEVPGVSSQNEKYISKNINNVNSMQPLVTLIYLDRVQWGSEVNTVQVWFIRTFSNMITSYTKSIELKLPTLVLDQWFPGNPRFKLHFTFFNLHLKLFKLFFTSVLNTTWSGLGFCSV